MECGNPKKTIEKNKPVKVADRLDGVTEGITADTGAKHGYPK